MSEGTHHGVVFTTPRGKTYTVVRKRTAVLLSGGLCLLGLMIGGASGSSRQSDASSGVHASLSIAGRTTSTTTVTATSQAAGPATIVSDGTYRVGVDLAAGNYRGTCPNFGYWARLRSSDTSDIITNDIASNGGLMQFTAQPGEWVQIRNCTFSKAG